MTTLRTELERLNGFSARQVIFYDDFTAAVRLANAQAKAMEEAVKIITEANSMSPMAALLEVLRTIDPDKELV